MAEWFYDHTDESYDQRTPYQRCLNCGAIEDALIRANRVHAQHDRTSRLQSRPRTPRQRSWDRVGLRERLRDRALQKAPLLRKLYRRRKYDENVPRQLMENRLGRRRPWEPFTFVPG